MSGGGAYVSHTYSAGLAPASYELDFFGTRFDGKDAIFMAFVAMRMERVNDRVGHLALQDDTLESMCDGTLQIVEENMQGDFLGMSLRAVHHPGLDRVAMKALMMR